MNLHLNINLADLYKSNSQKARILTEDWAKQNTYCPNCGDLKLYKFENNLPVADFFCKYCNEEFELKSKRGQMVGTKINDGAYSTMIERINSENNPNFFFLTYDNVNWNVINFMIIPKHFFVTDIIEKRKPLAATAKRAGWVGCNIELKKIPQNGRIFLVKNSKIINQKAVLSEWKRTLFLKNKKGSSRGWILDIMNCIDRIQSDTFKLRDIYAFEKELSLKHPDNRFIKDKIRQQLQLLRDKGIIEFKTRGTYKKIDNENI